MASIQDAAAPQVPPGMARQAAHQKGSTASQMISTRLVWRV